MELMGTAEIATFLGVSRQRVHALMMSDPEFPTPIAELSAGRVWDAAEVGRWAQNRPKPVRSRRATIEGVTVVAVEEFVSMQEVADVFLAGAPVVVETADVGTAVARRCIDFISGLVYGARGTAEEMMPKAVLVAPAGVRVKRSVRATVETVLKERRRHQPTG